MSIEHERRGWGGGQSMVDNALPASILPIHMPVSYACAFILLFLSVQHESGFISQSMANDALLSMFIVYLRLSTINGSIWRVYDIEEDRLRYNNEGTLSAAWVNLLQQRSCNLHWLCLIHCQYSTTKHISCKRSLLLNCQYFTAIYWACFMPICCAHTLPIFLLHIVRILCLYIVKTLNLNLDLIHNVIPTYLDLIPAICKRYFSWSALQSLVTKVFVMSEKYWSWLKVYPHCAEGEREVQFSTSQPRSDLRPAPRHGSC